MTRSEELAWKCMESMKDPGTQQDIVSLGLVKGVSLIEAKLTVELASPSGDIYQHEALANAIRRELAGLQGVEKINVTWSNAAQRFSENSSPQTISLHLPILNNATMPGNGDVNSTLNRVGIAPDAGYGECGPEQLPSPEASVAHERYEDWPPVFQWEIDPTDPSLIAGEEHVRLDDWEYEIWWQAHPADLMYASIQALHDDPVTGGPERQHPVGRNVVVNLVYDQRREAVVAVYGTARDFRPFIDAFRIGCNLEKKSKEHEV